ncbi:MAG: hypothetical protein KGI19_07765 [Thaumarchaeota archaeon]|nr:hypothetical protein [Nitrososphaerota archaeon]
MLLTIFKSNEKIDFEKISFDSILNLEENHYRVTMSDELGKEVEGIIITRPRSSILAWKTYSIKVGKYLNEKLQRKLDIPIKFDQYNFDDQLFRIWMEMSSQLIGCSFDYYNNELREVTMEGSNLKNSQIFNDEFRQGRITKIIFTLKDENILITARREGRLSITPDPNIHNLASILDILLKNGTRMVASI